MLWKYMTTNNLSAVIMTQPACKNWENLRTRFAGHTLRIVERLESELSRYVCPSDSSMADHIAYVMNTWVALEGYGAPLTERAKRRYLVESLPPDYQQFSEKWMGEDVFNVHNIASKLIELEHKRKKAPIGNAAMAFATHAAPAPESTDNLQLAREVRDLRAALTLVTVGGATRSGGRIWKKDHSNTECWYLQGGRTPFKEMPSHF
jgi:hypothetical protein